MGWKSEYSCGFEVVVFTDQNSGQIILQAQILDGNVFCSSYKIDDVLTGTDDASLQVVDFQIFAAPRITLKPLVPTFPCFANIVVSLLEKVKETSCSSIVSFLASTNICGQ